MQSLPLPGNKVYVTLGHEKLAGIVVSEISGRLFGNPGYIYVVKLIRDNRVFVKPISIHQLSERAENSETDIELSPLPKLNESSKGYSKFNEYPYFYKTYSMITQCRDGINRRKMKPNKQARTL